MRVFNLAKNFEETPTCTDILKRVRNTEIIYWVYAIAFIAVFLAGFSQMTNAPKDDFKQIAIGLFWSLFAMINVAVIKIWIHIKLTMYYIIWDRNNTLEAEIRKSEAEDL